MNNPYSVILYPFVTEKTMSQLEVQNKLEFVVARTANKHQIAEAVEKLFAVKVEAVNTRIRSDGKHAIVKLSEGYSAEDIGMRIGIF